MIALTGISGSGKDYLVSYLVNELGYTRVSFSDQLKEISNMIYPWLEKDYPPIVKEQPLDVTTSIGEHITKTPRQIWLKLNMLRDIEDGIFIRMLEEKLVAMGSPDKIVISDIRPQLEWDWCKKMGFTTIYIDPLKLIYEPNDFDKQVLTYKDQADYVFENDFKGLNKFIQFMKDVNENKKGRHPLL
jgi:hypothetical protein